DTWNAKSPDNQAADALAADEKHVQALEQLTDAELTAVSLPFFGMNLDAAGMVRLRLGEHALHTWDLAGFTDPPATLAAPRAATGARGPGGCASRQGAGFPRAAAGQAAGRAVRRPHPHHRPGAGLPADRRREGDHG